MNCGTCLCFLLAYEGPDCTGCVISPAPVKMSATGGEATEATIAALEATTTATSWSTPMRGLQRSLRALSPGLAAYPLRQVPGAAFEAVEGHEGRELEGAQPGKAAAV